MPVYNKRGILLLPKVIVLNPKDGSFEKAYHTFVTRIIATLEKLGKFSSVLIG